MNPTTTVPAPQRRLGFRVGKRRYGVDVSRVERVLGADGLLALPEAPAGVAGAVRLLSRLVTVLDLRPHGAGPAAADVDARIIVLGQGGATVGLLVDGLIDVAGGTLALASRS